MGFTVSTFFGVDDAGLPVELVREVDEIGDAGALIRAIDRTRPDWTLITITPIE